MGSIRDTRHTRRRPSISLVALLLLALFAVLTAGCGADAGSASSRTPSSTGATQPPSPTAFLPPTALHGPANFMLSTPPHFVDVSGVTTDDGGATTPLDVRTIRAGVNRELQHLLFVVDQSERVTVYSPGVSPTAARVVSHFDGSVTISYTQTVNSEAGTVTIAFEGLLLHEQMNVTYQQQYLPSVLINASESEVAATFQTRVRWIAADQIPTAPTAGSYRLTNGGIALSWSPGQHAAAYDVYRQISDHDQQFQLLTQVRQTSYEDRSKEAQQGLHAPKGITYAIFSVGPGGVENPDGIIINVAG